MNEPGLFTQLLKPQMKGAEIRFYDLSTNGFTNWSFCFYLLMGAPYWPCMPLLLSVTVICQVC